LQTAVRGGGRYLLVALHDRFGSEAEVKTIQFDVVMPPTTDMGADIDFGFEVPFASFGYPADVAFTPVFVCLSGHSHGFSLRTEMRILR
jgi:hypothetical protein